MGRRSLALLLGVLVAGALIVPAPVEAAGTIVGQCRITINPWPGAGSNDPCVGTAVGAFQDGSTNVPCSPCNLVATVDTYAEECLGSEPPLIGDARGDLTISNGTSTVSPHYEWTRVGAVAVITLSGPPGAGVGAFVPVATAIPTCAVPGSLSVLIAGVALFL